MGAPIDELHALSGPVVAGVDGSWLSRRVLRAAADDARRLGAALALVAVVRDVTESHPDDDIPHVDYAWTQDRARRRLEEAAAAVGEQHPQLDVTTYSLREADLHGSPPEPLTGAGRLVVGAEGGGGRKAFGLESISRTLLKSCDCPVLVVPDDPPGGRQRPAGTVVAGIAGAVDADVVREAVAETRRRDTDLELVHAYRAWVNDEPVQVLATGWESGFAAVREAGIAASIPVSVSLVPGDPVTILLRQAAHASLVVIGSRGPDALAGLALDSVSHGLLRSANCPLLVVPKAGAGRQPQKAGALTAHE